VAEVNMLLPVLHRSNVFRRGSHFFVSLSAVEGGEAKTQ
jgi:hypothetical protein